MRSVTLPKLAAEYQAHGVFGAMSAAGASEVHVLALLKICLRTFPDTTMTEVAVCARVEPAARFRAPGLSNVLGEAQPAHMACTATRAV